MTDRIETEYGARFDEQGEDTEPYVSVPGDDLPTSIARWRRTLGEPLEIFVRTVTTSAWEPIEHPERLCGCGLHHDIHVDDEP